MCKQDVELRKFSKILISSDGTEGSRIASIEHGADDYLCKPITQSILDELSAIFMYYAKTAYLEYANEPFLKMMGYTQEQLDGHTYEKMMTAMIHSDDMDIVSKMLQSLLKDGICGGIIELRTLRLGFINGFRQMDV